MADTQAQSSDAVQNEFLMMESDDYWRPETFARSSFAMNS